MRANCLLGLVLFRIDTTIAVLVLSSFGLIACSACTSKQTPEQPLPTLTKFAKHLPKPKPPRPKPLASDDASDDDGSVQAVLSKGCTTSVVKPLSLQIIGEANCIRPNSYAPMPKLGNLAFGDAVFAFLRKPARDALIKVLKKGRRHRMKINSMLRTVAQQYLLYDWYQRKRCGIKLAAVPGESNHQSGLAIDISSPARWRKRLQRAGFRWLGKRDRWHFDFVGRKRRRPKKEKTAIDVRAFQRLWNRNHPTEAIREDGGWGAATEDALRRAPRRGFAIGPSCAADGGGSDDAQTD